MPEFLSPEWIAALDRAAQESHELRASTTEIDATVEQVVPDAPIGAVRYHVTLAHGDVRVHPGPAEAADLTLLVDYDVARAINDGTTTAQLALASGRLKIQGGMTAFVGHERALAAIGDIFGVVRTITTYAERSA